jgi:hypothetical protein
MASNKTVATTPFYAGHGFGRAAAEFARVPDKGYSTGGRNKAAAAGVYRNHRELPARVRSKHIEETS